MDQKGERAPQPKIIREDLIDKGEIIFFLLFEFWLIKLLKIVRHSVLTLFSVFDWEYVCVSVYLKIFS